MTIETESASPAGSRPVGRGSALDEVRRRNLSTVLSLVHANGRLSRADLVRETGLNRSTIAAIVSDLERRELVVESAPRETTGVGRPSFVITPATTTVAVAVNPEVDAVTIGLIALGGNVVRRFRFEHVRTPTPKEVVNVVAAVLDGIRPELQGRLRTIGIGIAVPGLVRSGDGLVELAPGLEWREVPFAAMLSEATGYPAWAANDATCGVVAEHVFGGGRDLSDLVYLNGGASGIGGGVIAGGSVLTGASGYAGEFGHTLVNTAGRPCHCGATGCLESEVVRSELLAAVGLEDTEHEQLETRLREAVASGDETVREVVERQAGFLGIALRNIVNVFDPRAVSLGGFLGQLFGAAEKRIVDIVRTTALPGSRRDVQIVRAALAQGNLLVGAAELAFAGLLADPTTIELSEGAAEAADAAFIEVSIPS